MFSLDGLTIVNDVGMNLPECDHPHFARANRLEEFLAIVANTLTRVPVRESQIEHFFASILPVARRLSIRWRPPVSC